MNATEKKATERIFEISVPKEQVESAYEKELNRVIKNADINGFRKGKAPAHIVESKFGKAAIFETVVPELVEGASVEAMRRADATGERFIGRPSVSITAVVPGESIVCEFSFAVFPKVKVGDFKKLKTKFEKPSADEKEIDAFVEELRDRHAKESLKDGIVEQGDKVIIDFEVLKDLVAVENGSAKKYPFIVGRNALLPEFEKAITGKKAGDEVEIDFTYPEAYFDKHLAGSDAHASIKVREVFMREVPDANDAEWLKTVANASSLDELKKVLTDNILHEKAHEAEQKFERELLEELISISEFGDIAESMIAQEKQRMFDELSRDISSKGTTVEQYLLQIKKTKEELLAEFAPLAEKRIKIGLLIDHVGETESVEISEKDISDRIDKIIEHEKKYHGKKDSDLEFMKSDAYKDRMGYQFKMEKTVQFIKDKLKKSIYHVQ